MLKLACLLYYAAECVRFREIEQWALYVNIEFWLWFHAVQQFSPSVSDGTKTVSSGTKTEMVFNLHDQAQYQETNLQDQDHDSNLQYQESGNLVSRWDSVTRLPVKRYQIHFGRNWNDAVNKLALNGGRDRSEWRWIKWHNHCTV